MKLGSLEFWSVVVAIVIALMALSIPGVVLSIYLSAKTPVGQVTPEQVNENIKHIPDRNNMEEFYGTNWRSMECFKKGHVPPTIGKNYVGTTWK